MGPPSVAVEAEIDHLGMLDLEADVDIAKPWAGIVDKLNGFPAWRVERRGRRVVGRKAECLYCAAAVVREVGQIRAPDEMCREPFRFPGPDRRDMGKGPHVHGIVLLHRDDSPREAMAEEALRILVFRGRRVRRDGRADRARGAPGGREGNAEQHDGIQQCTVFHSDTSR